MKPFQVFLTRSYSVNIEASNEEEALHYSEFYIGGEKDISNSKERESGRFKIGEIEMIENDAYEINEIGANEE